MREKPKKRLGEILVESEVLSPQNLEEALVHQKKEGGLIGQILIRLGYVAEEDVAAALSRQLGIPYLMLANYSINLEAAQKFDEEFCRKNFVIVFDEAEKKVFAAVGDPLNEAALEEIEKRTGLKLQLFLSTPSEIFNMLELVFSANAKKAMKKAG